jgi:hypothetical protein
VFFDEVFGEGADHIDAQGILLGILKRRGDKFESNAFSAQFLGDFRMPDSHPAVAVGFELQIAALPILLDLKPALDYSGCVAHIGLAFSVCKHWCSLYGISAIRRLVIT